MKYAVLSDIHGNSWALEAVLNDIKSRKPDLIVNLGDMLYGPLDPLGTYKMIKSEKMICISGNQDRAINEYKTNSQINHTMKYVLKQLNQEALGWLKTLPETRELDCEVFICHGTPYSDTTYLLEQLNESYTSVNSPEKIEELLTGVMQEIIFCGHSHLPRFVESGGRIIINPGSVGLPAYEDNLMIYHKMQNYHNHAQYCIVEIKDRIVKREQISVPYDYYRASDCAARNNRPDWANWIKTGMV